MNDDKNKQEDIEETKEAVEGNAPEIEATANADAQAADKDVQEESIETQLEQAQLEVTKLKDAYLRAKAEEDNVRRRSEKEIANGRKFAVEGFAKEMMTVRDSLKLACDIELSEEAGEAVKNVHEGVEVTLKQLDAAFGRFSLTEINPEPGSKLDPNLHQAMSLIDSDDVESGCVINVIQAGFQLHDRLLRPAMVVVAK
ncbi:UNVERIFIED_CONTAM: hypothetical protein GTU68_028287 [Idotea baltica]|nr:hypothetical protein [Idotea baltica]